MAVNDTKLWSDGKAVDVFPTSPIKKDTIAVFGANLLGAVTVDAESGEQSAIEIASRERQIEIPAGVAATLDVGDYLYIDTTDVVGHAPQPTAYYTTSGANRVKTLLVTRKPEADNIVTGILTVVGGGI